MRIAKALLAAALLLAGPSAVAREPDERLTFQAGHVEADPSLRQIDLQDGVVLCAGRYRLTADHLRLSLDGAAFRFEGDGRLALCPCPDPPVTFAASGGRRLASGDLFLFWPRVELFKVPVFALPLVWLRSPDQPGLLPPFVALRGADGLLIGAGVHLPWRGGDGALRALDLTAAGYPKGGAALGVRLLSPSTTVRIDADWIQGTRVAVEARGFLAPAPRERVTLAWEVDAIRGDRARRGTIDLAAASAPFDHAIAETSIRASSGPLTALVAGGLLARAGRGEGTPVVGPEASASAGGALGRLGTWEAAAGGMVLGDAATGEALPIGQARLATELDARPGPFALRLRAGGRALVAGAHGPQPPIASPDARDPAPLDAALGARLALELPLIRSFGAAGAAPGEAPLVHWIAPAVELGGLLTAQRGELFRALFAPLERAAAIGAGGLSTALGRSAGTQVRLDLHAGVLAPWASAAEALAHARLTADASLAAGKIDLAVTSGPAALPRGPSGQATGQAPGSADSARPGFALLARGRLGPAPGPALLVDLAASGGGDPRAARSIESLAGEVPGAAISALAGPGATLGLGTAIPFPASLRTTLRADVDLGAGALVAVRGLTEYRHPCGCFALTLSGAHRTGREGVDVAVSIDLAPASPANLLR